jgi:hypothetical protein
MKRGANVLHEVHTATNPVDGPRYVTIRKVLP